MNLPSKRILILTSMLAAARVALLATAATRSPSIAADSCESLRSLKLPGTTIVLSERVAAGAFRLPDAYIGGPWAPGPRGGQPVVALQDLPAFCRVQGVIRPEVGDPEDLILDFIDLTRDVHARQSVVTSGWRAQGLASLFPPGLPIGEVTSASIVEQEASQQVHLRPYVDIANLDLVQVLTGGSRG